MLHRLVIVKILIIFFINVNADEVIRQFYQMYAVDMVRAVPGQFPWIVWIRTMKDDGSTNTNCIGNIIGEQWILTTANCIRGATEAKVHPGALETGKDYYLIVKSFEFVIHEDYDLGLIKLKLPLCFNELVNKIELSNKTTKAHTVVNLIRWYTESTHLTYSHYATLKSKDCHLSYGKSFKRIYEFCTTSGPDYTSCTSGYSGSGAVAYHNSEPYLAGIYSFSQPPCEKGGPLVFVDVSKFKPWIQENTGI